jgi:hypothetical protein
MRRVLALWLAFAPLVPAVALALPAAHAHGCEEGACSCARMCPLRRGQAAPAEAPRPCHESAPVDDTRISGVCANGGHVSTPAGLPPFLVPPASTLAAPVEGGPAPGATAIAADVDLVPDSPPPRPLASR